MLRCKPERSPRQALALVFGSAALTLGVFLLGTVIPVLKIWLQAAGILLLVGAVFAVIRYTVTEIEYAVSADTFFAAKISGGKRTTVCTAELSSAVALLDKKTFANSKEYSNYSEKISLRQNIIADTYIIVCSVNERLKIIEIEPNAAFVSVLTQAIEAARKP